MRFMEAYEGWQHCRLTQKEAARILGHEWTFRRYICRYEESGKAGLYDKRLTQASHRAAPVDEVMQMTEEYRRRYYGWNVKHYYSFYRKQGGCRSYSWVKDHLQAHGLVAKSHGLGKHRTRRDLLGFDSYHGRCHQ